MSEIKTTESVSKEREDISVSSSELSTAPLNPIESNLATIRLTLEEIIENDNRVSRNYYLQAETEEIPESSCCSSVSSAFSSNVSELTANSLYSQTSSNWSSAGGRKDAFRGVEDEEFGALDRYGFIIVPGQGSSELAVNNDEYAKKHQRRLEREKEKEVERSLKWLEMLKALEGKANDDVRYWPTLQKKFKNRLVKGVPDCLRSKVWEQLSSCRGLYAEDDESENNLNEEEFESLYLRVSGFERQIDLDIERTLRDHVLFKIRFSQAQISLFKILVAYSNLDKQVGYCQGMSTVAAFLLLYFDEKRAFRVLVRLMRRDDLRRMYETGFPLLFEYFWIHERLMRKFLPRLWNHLERHSITTSIYATKWYLTLFLTFPIKLATRIWDLLFFYGIDILPLTAIALLKLHEKALLSMSYEQTMQFLNRLADSPTCANPDKLLQLIEKLGSKYFGGAEVPLVKGKVRGLNKYRQEYRDLLAQGKI